MQTEDDYTEEDRYDWDRSSPDQHCIHGTFIGSWAGPDLLCGWCEDGISFHEMIGIQHQAEIRRWKQQRADLARQWRACLNMMFRLQYGDWKDLSLAKKYAIRAWLAHHWMPYTVQGFEALLESRPIGVRSTLTAEAMGRVLEPGDVR